MCTCGASAAATEDKSLPSLPYPSGDVRNCLMGTPNFSRMVVLPGIGFDNLRDLDMGQVHAYTFSKCSVSHDGKYLLPDDMMLLPSPESKVDVFAEYVQHWDNYTSMTSASLAMHFGYLSIVSSKFSAAYSQVKSHMVSGQSDYTRVQVRNKICTIKTQPGIELHPTFKSHLFDIVAHFQNNNTEFAHYLAELLIRDYGTHVITSVDAGAILSQIDFITKDSDSSSSQKSATLKSSASANFFGRLSVGLSFQYKQSNDDIDAYRSSRTHSIATNVGGPPLTPNTTLDEWEKGVPDALAAIDRSGDPLHFVINSNTLPELQDTTVIELQRYIEKSVGTYYKANTYIGCTDPSKKNFNYEANLDDGHCSPRNTNFSFGGIYQICNMDANYNTEDLCNGGPPNLFQKNPLTGDYRCPSHYVTVQIYSGKFVHNTQKIVKYGCGFLHAKHCYYHKTLTSIAHYDTYWCAAAPGVPQNEGYLFGGYFTSKQTNPITGAMSCPRYFYSLHLAEDIQVCVSTDYTRGRSYSVDFGGMESCSMGNPLAEANQNDLGEDLSWPHSCPPGHKHYLMAVENSCEINVCIRPPTAPNSKPLIARVPPNRRHPKVKNGTMALAVYGRNGIVFLKSKDNGWDQIDSTISEGLLTLQQNNVDLEKINPSSKGQSHMVITATSVTGTIVLGILVIVAVFTGRCVYKRHKKRKADRNSYVTLNNDENTPLSNNFAADI